MRLNSGVLAIAAVCLALLSGCGKIPVTQSTNAEYDTSYRD